LLAAKIRGIGCIAFCSFYFFAWAEGLEGERDEQASPNKGAFKGKRALLLGVTAIKHFFESQFIPPQILSKSFCFEHKSLHFAL